MCVSGETDWNPPHLRSFSAPDTASKIPRPVLDLPLVLLSSATTPTAAVNLGGDIDGSSIFMSTLDNRLSPAFPSKGNATVTFDGLTLC
jgi:hypothetical protein